MIDPVKPCSNVSALRIMYETIEVQISNLLSLDVATMWKKLYVGNLIRGTTTVEKAASATRIAKLILSEAYRDSRLWSTNSPILDDIWKNQIECQQSAFGSCTIPMKISGLFWNTKDTLKVELNHFSPMKEVINEIAEFKNLSVPRFYFNELQATEIEVHIFSEVSPSACSAVACSEISRK
ncbi:hypothetical protein NPIL_602641 [Nephila pilipes]|uniref:Uncharacterized protein n=1 Tax=Nephila pilipes TaxID=299642 RepID=A0A8X6MTN0_NEPPI|nr:hypothetical protein NPIL_602641 [Nephila pilipes]